MNSIGNKDSIQRWVLINLRSCCCRACSCYCSSIPMFIDTQILRSLESMHLDHTACGPRFMFVPIRTAFTILTDATAIHVVAMLWLRCEFVMLTSNIINLINTAFTRVQDLNINDVWLLEPHCVHPILASHVTMSMCCKVCVIKVSKDHDLRSLTFNTSLISCSHSRLAHSLPLHIDLLTFSDSSFHGFYPCCSSPTAFIRSSQSFDDVAHAFFMTKSKLMCL